jgi:hypothetical protein
MIRLSLVSLLLSALMGGLILTHKAVPVHPALWGLLPLHYELAIWGWLVQFVMGTAYWMFPRHLKGPGRGSARMAGLMVALYNTGLVLLLLSSLMGSVKTPLALGGRGLLASAVMLFGGLMWHRVVSYRER